LGGLVVGRLFRSRNSYSYEGLHPCHSVSVGFTEH
jgi:hypothetical protein